MQVKERQIWKDNDKRMGNRHVRVERIEGEMAICSRVVHTAGDWMASCVKLRTKISLRRFKPTATGYTFVDGPTDAIPGPLAASEPQER